MAKMRYLMRIILPRIGFKILILWGLTVYLCYVASYAAGVLHTQNVRSTYYLDGAAMEHMLLVSDANAGSTPKQEAGRNALLMERLRALPGVEEVYEQTRFRAEAVPGAQVNYYPQDAFAALNFVDAQGKKIDPFSTATEYPLWVDFALRDTLQIGSTLDLQVVDVHYVTHALPQPFVVAGYLNADRGYNSLFTGGADMSLEDLVWTHGSVPLMVATSSVDPIPTGCEAYRGWTKLVKTRLPADAAYIELSDRVANAGLGRVFTYDMLRARCSNYYTIPIRIYATTFIIMLPMLLLGFVSIQAVIMARQRSTVFVLTMQGMRRSEWSGAWLCVLFVLLIIPALLGYGICWVILPTVFPTALHPPIVALPLITAVLLLTSTIALMPSVLQSSKRVFSQNIGRIEA